MLVPASPVDSEDEKEEADAALVNDLLEPMIKSTIYTAESLNRRQVCSCDQRRHGQTGVLLKVLPYLQPTCPQAAAIGAHFVDAGKQSSESVRFFMKKLKVCSSTPHDGSHSLLAVELT